MNRRLSMFAILLGLALLPVSRASALDEAAARAFDEAMAGAPEARSPISREEVSFLSDTTPGTIIVSTTERRLYLILEGGRALRYGIGVARDGFEWSGNLKVTMKRKWPDWTPPEQMLERRPDLPRHMEGGLDNPLGARALYLGSTLYRIHGSNEPETIGEAVSSGCIRMANTDIIDLYDRVLVGTRVIVETATPDARPYEVSRSRKP